MTNAEIKALTRSIAGTGLINMFDRTAVIRIANGMGENEYALWAGEHQHDYGMLILTGKLPGDDGVEEGDGE
jgi:hypothetical protein